MRPTSQAPSSSGTSSAGMWTNGGMIGIGRRRHQPPLPLPLPQNQNAATKVSRRVGRPNQTRHQCKSRRGQTAESIVQGHKPNWTSSQKSRASALLKIPPKVFPKGQLTTTSSAGPFFFSNLLWIRNMVQYF